MGLITRIKRHFHLATTMPTTDTTITFQDVLHHMQTDILTMAIDDLSEEIMATTSGTHQFERLVKVHDEIVKELATRKRWDMEAD